MSRFEALVPRQQSHHGVKHQEERERVDLARREVDDPEADVVEEQQLATGGETVGEMPPEHRGQDDRPVEQARREGDLGPRTVESDQDQQGEGDREGGGGRVDWNEREKPGPGEQSVRPAGGRGDHGVIRRRSGACAV